MSFDRYWEEHMRGVEESEERVNRTWLAVLLALKSRERWFRRTILQHVSALPVTNEEVPKFDIRAATRGAYDQFRDRARRTTERFITAVHGDLVGTTDAFSYPRISGPRRMPTKGLVPPEIRRNAVDFGTRWMKAREIEAKDRDEIKRAAATKNPPPVEAPHPIIARIQPIEPTEDDLQGDIWDTTVDGMGNIPRQIEYLGWRGLEDVARVVTKHQGPQDVQTLMLGPLSKEPSTADADNEKGVWKLDRNKMKLSTVAHVRAVHRRRSVTCGLRDGHQLFRLDVPRRYLPKLRENPSGRIGTHAWQVRPLSEWRGIIDRISQQRQTSSSLDTLGLGYGDYSYVTPIPTIYLRQAIAQGTRFRARWLVAAGLVLASNKKGAA